MTSSYIMTKMISQIWLLFQVYTHLGKKKTMLKYRHNEARTIDATFGTNVSNYPLFLLSMLDDQRNDIPVAWVLTSLTREDDLVMYCEPLQRHLYRNKEDFLPSCFIVDDANYQRNVIKRV